MPAAAMIRVIHFLRHRAVPAGDEPDADMLRRFVGAGEGAAFAGLVRRHGAMVLGVCRRVLNDVHDAEDAFQATFLVLARKAGSVRKPDALASWLYGVAYRVALKTRTAATVRHRAAALPPDLASSLDPVAEAAWHELRPLLDEELNRLPEKYRAPLVLCYLEGKTNEEAARLLGWTKGTVSGRLARARDLLRPRLARRGVALWSGGMTVLLAQAAAPASAALVDTTVRAGLPGAASGPAAALAEGVIKAMFLTQVKTWTAVVAALGLVTAGAGALWRQARADEPARPAVNRERERPEQDRAPKDRPGVLFTVPEDPKADAGEMQKLQGTWQAVALERNGEKLSAEAAKRFRIVIQKDTITFNPDAAPRSATFRLGPTSKPKAIWLTPSGTTEKETVRGIYSLEDGRLQLCVDNDQGKTIPTEFATKPASGLMLLVLERATEARKSEEPKAVEGTALATLMGSGAPVRAVAFSPDGRAVAACAKDGRIYCWEAKTGKLLHKVEGNRWRSLAFSPDAKLIAAVGSRPQQQGEVGTVHVVDAITGKILFTLKEEGGSSDAVAFSPDGRHLATAGSDGTMQIYDLPRGARRLVWHGHNGAISALAFSPDGKTLASGGADHSVKLWDSETGKEVRVFTGTAEVTGVAFSRNGKLILAGSQDGAVRLWDVQAGKELLRLDAHRNGVRSAVFSPDRQIVATAGADGTVKLWDASLGRQLRTIVADKKAVNGIAFSPDGQIAASGCADGTVKLWHVGQ